MADKKISALTSLAQGDVAASTDVLPIVDTSATETKKITASALVGAGMTAGVTNVDINSGAIDGTTIGASSASTGAFTTLSASSTVSGTGFSTYLASPPAIGGTTAAAGSFTTLTTSSTVTLNGGTANGVLYLNGSKVATTGSAFVFDGTNVGIGTASPDANFKLDVQAATGRVKLTSTTGTNSVVYQANNTGGTLNVGIDSSTGGSLFGVGAYAAGVWYSGNYPLVFGVNNAEGFRLTSSTLYTASGINVGIGTSSPSKKLDIRANVLGESALVLISNDNTAGTGGSPTVASLEFASSGVAKASIAAAVYGNDWLSFRTGSNTERMRLTTSTLYTDSSISVGIGTSSPGYKLTVAGASGSAVVNLLESGVRSWGIRAGGTATNTFDIADFTAATTRLTIDSSGNVGIGTSSPDYNLSVGTPGTTANSYIQLGSTTTGTGSLFFGDTTGTGSGSFRGYVQYDHNLDALIFGSAATNQARITSGGKFLLNTTSTVVSGDEICGMIGTSGIGVKCTGGSVNFAAGFWNNATSGDNNLVIFYTETGGTQRGSITYNRGAGQVAYNVTSDVRLKNNIADAVDAGSKVDALKVRQFDWKETGNHVDYGFVAQELDAIAPQAVSKPEDEEAMWSVDYSKLVPMLVKEIQSLRARVAQLESK